MKQHLGRRQQRDRQHAPPAPLALAPGHPDERRRERQAHRARQHAERAEHRGPEEAPALGEQERARREHEEEALRVDGREHERERRDREEEHRAARDRAPEALVRELVEQAHADRHQRRRDRGSEPDQVDERRERAQAAQQHRIERQEGGVVAVADRGVVAVDGDRAVPDPVPGAEVAQHLREPDALRRAAA